jgi:uncharacterized membrane protein YqaE (UPF0057 family)
MFKYILAFFIPFLSFFMRKKMLNGLICFILAVALYYRPPIVKEFALKYNGLASVIYLLIGFIPSIWAMYSVYKTKEEPVASGRISDLS